ncbi:MAG: sulfite exporter TauE/SafE family protein [Oligosphaeraceae bacterium]|nr:sulfite exporter TauE/SafE family protein [Oligosphaeraceae bacterium]
MSEELFALSPSGWLLACFCALVVGMSKAGLPGLGSLAVPLMAMLFPPTWSSGILLPLLVAGDFIGVYHFKRHADWRLLLRLLPTAFCGIVTGFFLMRHLLAGDLERANHIVKVCIGTLILILLFFNLLKEAVLKFDFDKLPGVWNWTLVICFGLIAGITTQLANAAGPFINIYLLSMRLPKDNFVGTSAWYFCILNCCKLPFMIGLGSINRHSLCFNLKLLPALVVGALLAIFISAKMNEKHFSRLVFVLTFFAALKLLFA